MDLSDLPVALYARLSENPDGTCESAETQVAAGRRFCERTWPGRPLLVFKDDDLSGADERVVRPDYQAMLDAIRRGQVGAVATKMQSRITRQVAQWDEFKVACLRAGIEDLHTWTGGNVCLADGRSLPGDIMNLIDADYSKKTKLAINDALSELAQQGRPPGGKTFGYLHGTNEALQKIIYPDPDTAPEVRPMAERVLAGDSLASIVRDLEERGVPTARGGKWSTTTVKSILMSPTITGLRVYGGSIVGEGNWEPLLDRDTWHAVKAMLGEQVTIYRSNGVIYPRGRRTRPVRRYLLTGGIAICGRCGMPLIAQQRRRRTGNTTPCYLCSASRGGCNGLGIMAVELEDHVSERFLAKLNDKRFHEQLAATDEAAADRERLQREQIAVHARRTEAALNVSKGIMSFEMGAIIDAGCVEELARIAAELSALPVPAGGQEDPDVIKADWPYLSLNEQRSSLFRAEAHVVVFPAAPGTRKFDTGRVDVWFKGDRASARSRRALALRNKDAM